MPSLVGIDSLVLEKKIFEFGQCILLFHNYLPLEKGGPFIEQTWLPFTKGCFVPSLVETGSVVPEKTFFLIWSMYFRFFIIISPWKKGGPFIWINLNPLHPGMLCAKFFLNWHVALKKILNFFNVFSLFHNYLPLQKGVVFQLNKLESLSTKDWNGLSGSGEDL